MTGQKQATSDLLLETVLASLNDDKAEDIVQIDLRGKTEIGDYMIVCSGRSTRQVSAIPEVREFYQLEKMWLPQADAAS